MFIHIQCRDMQDTGLTIIIPVRHEEEGITDTLDAFESRVKTKHTILVVDDSIEKEDKTPYIVRTYARKHSGVSLLQKKYNDPDGFAAAIRRGIAAVHNGPIAIVMADLCDLPETIDAMVGKLKEGYDLVCASRYMQGGDKLGGPIIQGFLSRGVNWFIFHATGIPTHDITNSFKMYKNSVGKAIPVNASLGFECSMYMANIAYLAGAKVTEVPTVWHGRVKGKSKFRFIKRFLPYARVSLWVIRTNWEKRIMNLWN